MKKDLLIEPNGSKACKTDFIKGQKAQKQNKLFIKTKDDTFNLATDRLVNK